LLEDGDFRLTESSGDPQVLAEKNRSPAYSKDLRSRAKVNEMMDWINTQVCAEARLWLVYPQIFPQPQAGRRGARRHIAWGKEKGSSVAEGPR